MIEEKCNGWTNYDTWNAYNYLTNEENIYNRLRGIIYRGGRMRFFKFVAVEYIKNVRGDSSDCNLRKINWIEILESFSEDGF